MDLTSEALKNPTVYALLLIAVIAFWREWIVPGARYERIISERDRFIGIALRANDITEKSIDLARQVKD